MFDKILGGLFGGHGCHDHKKTDCNTSCDVLWIIILLLVLFNGGLFGLDICTLIILFIVFGGKFLNKGCDKKETRCC